MILEIFVFPERCARFSSFTLRFLGILLFAVRFYLLALLGGQFRTCRCSGRGGWPPLRRKSGYGPCLELWPSCTHFLFPRVPFNFRADVSSKNVECASSFPHCKDVNGTLPVGIFCCCHAAVNVGDVFCRWCCVQNEWNSQECGFPCLSGHKGSGLIRLAAGEVLCPLCSRVANCVLPMIPSKKPLSPRGMPPGQISCSCFSEGIQFLGRTAEVLENPGLH